MKNILLGICGGIAAYKSVELVRLLIKNQCNVRAVMTPSATKFITPLTFETISQQAVITDTFDSSMPHIELTRWADEIIIAPATANTIAKLANGIADNALTNLCLASTKKVTLIPGMNVNMWKNAATQKNIETLKQRSVQFIGPEHGEQACGDIGFGRMTEPEQIIQQLFNYPDLSNKRILITAGPTREAIDPIRFISNHSSGKMGYALAQACHFSGATVTLITGPTNIKKPKADKLISVITAKDMHDAVMSEINHNDIFISTAAIADYTPEFRKQKLKKQDRKLNLILNRTTDILSEAGKLENKPFLIGFAAETKNLIENAKQKMKSKCLDMIIANQIKPNGPFNSDENEVTIITKEKKKELGKESKHGIAKKIISELSVLISKGKKHGNNAHKKCESLIN